MMDGKATLDEPVRAALAVECLRDELSALIADYPQFGRLETGIVYPERRGAHGIARNDQGLIAIVRIGARKGCIEYDLPGGGIDPGESAAQALSREFIEETGLPVRAGRLIARARQFWRKRGVTPRNSDFHIFEAHIVGPRSAQIEPDHELIWLSPESALACLRHEAHKWALLRYLESI